MKTALPALAMGAGLMVSPDNLVLLGRFSGTAGLTGLALILFWGGLYLALAPALATGQDQPGSLTMWWAWALPAAAAGSATLFMSTGILVSSGFVFNEVFVYWFPNFGFAFLLLGLILVIQLLGQRPAQKAQVIFFCLTLLCLMPLVLAGLLPMGNDTMPDATTIFQAGPLSPATIVTPLLLWVGVDLGRLGLPGTSRPTVGIRMAAMAGALLFMAWALVAILHVPLTKLAGSSIPHIKTARAVLGDPGRWLMGGTIIFGTLSAVNLLFLGTRSLILEITARHPLPKWSAPAIPMLLAAGCGLMMGLGLAGHDRLETWIRAAALAWLLSYAVRGLLAGKNAPIHYLTAALVLAGFAVLLISMPGAGARAGSLAVILGVALAAGLLLKKRRIKHRITTP